MNQKRDLQVALDTQSLDPFFCHGLVWKHLVRLLHRRLSRQSAKLDHKGGAPTFHIEADRGESPMSTSTMERINRCLR